MKYQLWSSGQDLSQTLVALYEKGSQLAEMHDVLEQMLAQTNVLQDDFQLKF